MGDSERLAEAFAFMLELHRTQARKGTEIPYFTHLMAVAALVGEYGGTEDQVIAALLHDAVEDQGGRATLERIRERFGDVVTYYVEACSDTDTVPKPPWRERKERFLVALGHAEPAVRLIVAADKLHNARSIIKDLYEVGNALWGRFTGGREPTLWYCEAVVQALADGWSHPILRELEETERRLQALAARLKRALP